MRKTEIKSPGLFLEFDIDAYFRDPTPAPSLTQSIAKILIDRSPLHAWCAHPRLNPNHEDDDDKKFDVGNVAHRLLIGRGKNVVGVPFDDWRSKAAKEARESYRAAGTLAVLQHQYDRANAMALAAKMQLANTEHADAFTQGQGEVVVAWKDGDVWLRTMFDWLTSTTRPFDLKTSDMSCAPHAVQDRPSVMGWDIQAAWHEAALDSIDPDNAGRRAFHFIAQEAAEPYALTVVRISEADLTMGRKKMRFAVDLWRACIASGKWPSYGSETVISQPRGYLEQRWLEREVAHETNRASGSITADHLMAG